MRDFFCHKGKGLKGAPGGKVCGKSVYLLFSVVTWKKKWLFSLGRTAENLVCSVQVWHHWLVPMVWKAKVMDTQGPVPLPHSEVCVWEWAQGSRGCTGTCVSPSNTHHQLHLLLFSAQEDSCGRRVKMLGILIQISVWKVRKNCISMNILITLEIQTNEAKNREENLILQEVLPHKSSAIRRSWFYSNGALWDGVCRLLA